MDINSGPGSGYHIDLLAQQISTRTLYLLSINCHYYLTDKSLSQRFWLIDSEHTHTCPIHWKAKLVEVRLISAREINKSPQNRIRQKRSHRSCCRNHPSQAATTTTTNTAIAALHQKIYHDFSWRWKGTEWVQRMGERYNSKEWGCPETVIDYSTLIFLAV